MDTTSVLVAEQGLHSVTMSEIAQKTGIGRATLYKYFPDLEAILFAWHKRHINSHLEYLAEVGDKSTDATERLESVLGAHARHIHDTKDHHNTELAAIVHQGKHVAKARHRLRDFIESLLTDAAQTGGVRHDMPTSELAEYCIHALGAAQEMPSKAAVDRLVSTTLDALQPRT